MNAVQTRNEQFLDIDAKIDQLTALRKDLARKCAGFGPNNWTYTGRGRGVARMQHDLDVALKHAVAAGAAVAPR